MGTFFHPITLIGPAGEETIDALVDTGSTFTTIPRPILERLGIASFTRARLRLATGEAEVTELGEVIAQLDAGVADLLLVPRLFPRECGGVFRLLLRLLSAGGVHPAY